MKFLIVALLVASATAGILPAAPTLPTPSIPAIPSFTNLVSSIPTIPTGQLSYFQIYTLLSDAYKSPLGKLLPSFTEVLKMALQINSASNSIQDARDKINAAISEAAKDISNDFGIKPPANPLSNIANMFAPTTTAAPSILGSIGNYFG